MNKKDLEEAVYDAVNKHAPKDCMIKQETYVRETITRYNKELESMGYDGIADAIEQTEGLFLVLLIRALQQLNEKAKQGKLKEQDLIQILNKNIEPFLKKVTKK